MEHILADTGLRMTYLRHSYQLDELDQDAILYDLSEGSIEKLTSAYLTHINFNDYDHLVLAADCRTNRTVGLLGMNEGSTGQEAFLELRTAFVAPSARRRRIMDRMNAHALLRIAGSTPVPRVIFTRCSNPAWYRNLSKLARRFTGAVVFPDHQHPAIRLEGVRLTQRLARQVAPTLHFEISTATLRGGRIAAGLPQVWPGAHVPCKDPRLEVLFGQLLQPADQILLTIDLRSQTEATILNDARKVYRTRAC